MRVHSSIAHESRQVQSARALLRALARRDQVLVLHLQIN